MGLKKLGQTATEYLVILAVVIVIALIVVSIMGGIPGIGKNGQDKTNQIFWQTADIAFDSYANSNTTGMKINMKNNLNEGITINAFALNGINILATQPYIDTGNTLALTLNPAAVPGCVKGQSYSYNVQINYTTASNHAYTFSGYGHPMTGTCAN